MTTMVKQQVRTALRTRGADPTCDPMLVAQCERMFEDARTTLMMSAPFYGRFACRMQYLANPRVAQGTAATDGAAIYYNPTWIAKLTHRQVVGLVVHEVMHVAHGHQIRREERNPRGWNVATDHVINNELRGSSYDLPDGGLCDPEYRGLCAEEVYPQVYREPPPQPEVEVTCDLPGVGGESDDDDSDDDQQSSQSDDDAPEDDDSDADDDADTNSDADADADEDEDEDEDEDDTESESESGSGGQGATDDTDGEGAGPGGNDEPDDEPEERLPAGGVLDALDPVAEEQELNITLVEAGMCAKAMGKLPAHCARLINELTRANVHWKDILAEFLETNMREDYSMRRPNKRYMAQGVYLPSLKSEAAPELALIGDNSGSINEAQFSRCVRAIADCAATIRPERVHAVLSDTAVNYYRVFERGEEVRDLPTDTGGGGTDFSAAFDMLREEGVVPACAVYYTADACGYFGEEPEYPVLWLVESGAATPPWGRVVMLDDITEGVAA